MELKTRHHIVTAVIAVASLAGVTAASAADLSGSALVVRDAVAGNAYQNGGVAKEQVADMVRHMQGYDLRLTFSEGRHNAYVADVKLNVIDAAGHTVFGLDHAGPLTDVSLPPGHYRIEAEFAGVVRSGSVDLSAGAPAELYLHWANES